ncbi:MAG: Twin-arginine translocation pathway signal [Oceanospirillales bacterium LUC14_002_19_P2]|nr:MAG: Twin-arginine translocation pathway signal [Oceanospirillales bacterium LUC14_002_19_P2]
MTAYMKIPHALADDILALYQPSDSTLACREDGQSPATFIEALNNAGHYPDLIIFLAHALPVREAIWWACCCTDNRSDWNEAEIRAIQAACAWVSVPDETNRRHAEAMAQAAGLETAPGWVSQAAFWSGGSLIEKGQPAVQPPPNLYAHAVAGAINLCAVLPDGAEAEHRYPDFVRIGLNIASGGNGRLTDEESTV